jgi:hypothetical protein
MLCPMVPLTPRRNRSLPLAKYQLFLLLDIRPETENGLDFSRPSPVDVRENQAPFTSASEAAVAPDAAEFLEEAQDAVRAVARHFDPTVDGHRTHCRSLCPEG